MGKKGFLGPIGDDLPSLIPLIFALIIFFAVFSSAFQVFDKGNREFNDAVKSLRISNSIKGDSYIDGADDFFDACSKVSVRGINFKAAIVELELGVPTISIDYFKLVNEDKKIYSIKDGVKLKCSSFSDEDDLLDDGVVLMSDNADSLVRVFTIAFKDTDVESGFAVRPMLLVVVSWK